MMDKRCALDAPEPARSIPSHHVDGGVATLLRWYLGSRARLMGPTRATPFEALHTWAHAHGDQPCHGDRPAHHSLTPSIPLPPTPAKARPSSAASSWTVLKHVLWPTLPSPEAGQCKASPNSVVSLVQTFTGYVWHTTVTHSPVRPTTAVDIPEILPVSPSRRLTLPTKVGTTASLTGPFPSAAPWSSPQQSGNPPLHGPTHPFLLLPLAQTLASAKHSSHVRPHPLHDCRG